MRSLLVTGADTGVGKTWVVATLARRLAESGAAVEIVKVVETGVAPGASGDAATAAAGAKRPSQSVLRSSSSASPAAARGDEQELPVTTLRAGAGRSATAGGAISFRTLFTFREPLAPAAAAAAEGRVVLWTEILNAVRALPADRVDWRIFEGAGGIASPIDGARDWADFAAEVGVDGVIVVVRDQLGAINQARLCAGHAARRGVTGAAIWLNPIEPPPGAVAASTRAGIRASGLKIVDESSCAEWAENRSQGCAGVRPDPAASEFPSVLQSRLDPELRERESKHLLRRVKLNRPAELELSDNDYLALATDPALIAAGQTALARYGTSAAASPLIAGWKEPHQGLLDALASWHRFPFGMLWTSGYAANAAVLSTLPRRGDLILADRLIHHSMIAGLTRSGARFKRYPHLDLDRLAAELAAAPHDGIAGGVTFVVTESVFSMDGDYPDLARLAALKAAYPFFLILDEAHALGWYGPEGGGLAAEAGTDALAAVDLLVGTLGKTLASGGAYTLFRDATVRDALINHAGEFIYSTGIPPANAAIATAAIARVRTLATTGQSAWRAQSREFRAALRAAGWSAPDGDSPIIPIALPDESSALSYAEALRAEGIGASAVRPPTVPAGTSRLRLSIKRTFTLEAAERVLAALGAAKNDV